MAPSPESRESPPLFYLISPLHSLQGLLHHREGLTVPFIEQLHLGLAVTDINIPRHHTLTLVLSLVNAKNATVSCFLLNNMVKPAWCQLNSVFHTLNNPLVAESTLGSLFVCGQ